MNRKGRTVLQVTAGCVLLLSGGQQAQAADRIVAFGDSITAGKPYLRTGDGCINCGGYEPHLQYHLNLESRGGKVYNYGVSGESLIVSGVNRIDSVLAAERPDYVLIMEGTNDLGYYVDPNTVAYNVYKVARKVLAQGALPVVGTITPDTRYGWDDWKHIRATNAYIKNYVNSNPLICLSDQYSAIAPYWDNGYNYDQLHPNYWGYQLMGKTWYASLRSCNIQLIRQKPFRQRRRR